MCFCSNFPFAAANCTKLIIPTSPGFILLTMAGKRLVFLPSSVVRKHEIYNLPRVSAEVFAVQQKFQHVEDFQGVLHEK